MMTDTEPRNECLPLVSIGMTVHNAGQFLEETLDSLLAQDYPNFELVISDNASMDGSSEKCQALQERDKRVRYFRNEENLGAVRNWNRALELSRGEFFMWAADHDLWDASYLSKATSALRMSDDVILVYARATLIDSESQTIERLPDRMDTRGLTSGERFKHALWNLRRCHMIHGVMRTTELKRLGGFPNVWAMDMPLIAALSIRGAFWQLDEFLYFRRKNRDTAGDSDSEPTKSFHVSQLDPSKAARRKQKTGAELRRETRNSLILFVLRAPISLLTKIHFCLMTLSCYWSRYGVGLYGSEKLAKLLPKRLRRSTFLRPSESGHR